MPRDAATGRPPRIGQESLARAREPAPDWHMVIRYGGYATGLSEMMPAQDAVLDNTEIEEVTAYPKSVVDTRGYPPGEMNLMLPLSDQSWGQRYYVTLLWDFADGSFFQGW